MAGEKTKKIPKTFRQGPELTQKSDKALPLPLALPPAPQSPTFSRRGNLLFHSTPQTSPGFTSLYPTPKRIDSELSSHAAPLNIFSYYGSSTTWCS